MFDQETKKITIPTGGTAVRLVKNPSSVPYKNLSIFAKGAGNSTLVERAVLFGGYFVDSSTNQVQSFTKDSTHKGGVIQAVSAALGTDTSNIANIIYNHVLPLPGNSPSSPNGQGIYSAPVVLEFTNTSLVPVVLDVTFISETLTANQ